MIFKRLSAALAAIFVLAYIFQPGFRKIFWKLVSKLIQKHVTLLQPPPPKKKSLPPSKPATAAQVKPTEDLKQQQQASVQIPQHEIFSSEPLYSVFPAYNFPPITSFNKASLEDFLASLPIVVPNHAHKYWTEREQTRSLTKALYPLENWTKMDEKSGIVISSLSMDGFGLPFIRGDGLIPGDWSLLEVASVIQNNTARKYWDPRFDLNEPVEWLGSDEVVGYSVQKGTFPVAARDLVVLLGSFFDNSKKGLIYTTSVEHNRAPEPGTKGRVRAELLVASWVLEKRMEGVQVSYIVHVDPKGTVPSSLIKLVQTQTPMCIHGVRKYLESNGTLPFVIRGETHDLSPSPDVVFSQYELTASNISLAYSINHNRIRRNKVDAEEDDEKVGRIAIALPYNLYPRGATITVELDCESDQVECFSRLVDPEEYQTILSDAIQHVVEVWIEQHSISSDEHVSVSISICPKNDMGVFVNGDMIDNFAPQ